MLTICSIASSWPTILRRRPASNSSASRPVSVGSRTLLSRTILLTTLSCKNAMQPPCQLPISGVLAKYSPIFLGFGGPYLHAANQCPIRHTEKIQDHLGHIFGSDLPIGGSTTRAETGCDTARHNVAHADVFISEILHDRFAEAVQS